MEIEFCETFSGGYCSKQNAHIPRSWCFARCDVTKDHPSLIEQGVSFASEAIKFIRAGSPERPKELIEKLQEICKPCFYYNKDGKSKFQKKGPQCRQCGCGMTLKTAWATSRCRKGYWDKIIKEWEDADNN